MRRTRHPSASFGDTSTWFSLTLPTPLVQSLAKPCDQLSTALACTLGQELLSASPVLCNI